MRIDPFRSSTPMVPLTAAPNGNPASRSPLTPRWGTAFGVAAGRRCLVAIHGRVFTKEEIWENYTYFIKKVVPVAEEAGVRIGTNAGRRSALHLL